MTIKDPLLPDDRGIANLSDADGELPQIAARGDDDHLLQPPQQPSPAKPETPPASPEAGREVLPGNTGGSIQYADDDVSPRRFGN